MPTEAPKCRLPRFSLITLIVAVNVAGVLVWANVTTWHIRTVDSQYQLPFLTRQYTKTSDSWSRGWPFVYNAWGALRISESSEIRDPGVHISEELSRLELLEGRWQNILYNVGTCLTLLLTVATATELLVRRHRKAKRHDS